MHQGYANRPMYTGSPAHTFAPTMHPMGHEHAPLAMHGFCPSCCHPKAKCGCGCRQCRKEPKELLVKPTITQDKAAEDKKLQDLAARAAFVGLRVPTSEVAGAAAAQKVELGTGSAFIGGGCCVHLSIEYAPSTPTADSVVLVIVKDSEGTILAWAKSEKPGVGYQIKECIVTTKPGADLSVIVANMTARVRWCEVFSC